MTRVIGLDVGSGFTKAYDGAHMAMFPSVYAYRQSNDWENNGRIEGVGKQALEIAQHPDAVVIYPVINGKVQHSAYVNLLREALRRSHVLSFEKIALVTGLPYDMGKRDREAIKELMQAELQRGTVEVYPQAVGTLFQVDAKDGFIINIGHGTAELTAFEKLEALTGMSESIAADYVLRRVATEIQRRFGFKATTENLIELVSGRVSEISAFGKKTVRRDQIETVLRESIQHLAEKIGYDTKALLSQLPPGLKCSSTVILSGGGSMMVGLAKMLEKELGVKLIQPADPIYSNVLGYFKMGLKLHASDPA